MLGLFQFSVVISSPLFLYCCFNIWKRCILQELVSDCNQYLSDDGLETLSCWICLVVCFWLCLVTCGILVGEGNGNPFQYSYLENPVDRGAWWAAVHRTAQAWTRLKWLSMCACIGEGNGNPLQYSYLENPVDRGASWAAVHRVTQAWRRLKWLSMHACIGEGNGNPLQ